MAVDRLLVSVAPGEIRIAEMTLGKLTGLTVDRAGQRSIIGNIIAGRVEAVMPNLQAAFVDIGEARSGYLGLPEARTHGAEPNDAISDYVVEGDTILVQITQDPEAEKGAKLTMKPALTGRDLIFTPGRPGISISRRISDVEERDRLSDALKSYGTKGGFIVRTSAQEAEAEDLIREANRLSGVWSQVETKLASARPPETIFNEAAPAKRLLREAGGVELNAVVTDDPDMFNTLKAFTEEEMPDVTDLIRLHRDKAALFRFEGVDEMINAALDPHVALSNGGNIRINETAALVAVDVNTGGAVGGNRRQVIKAVNSDAARVFAEQMRLRNLSGLIVIDFVSMRDERDREDVLEALRQAVTEDSRRPFVGGFTRFGLVELTRRRQGLSLSEILCVESSVPEKSSVTTGLQALRRVIEEATARPAAQFTIEVSGPVRHAFETRLTAAVEETKNRLGGGLTVIGNETLKADGILIYRGTKEIHD